MKQTIQTENNVQATVEIPYEKLQTKNPYYMVQTSSQPQVVVVPQCIGYPHQFCTSGLSINPTTLESTKTLIRQLQTAYRDDVEGYKRKVVQLQNSLANANHEVQKCRNAEKQYVLNIERLKNELQKQKQERKSLNKICERLRKERETIMRTKISDFQAAKNKQLTDYEQFISKMKQTHQLQLTEIIKSHTTTFELENKKKDEHIFALNTELDKQKINLLLLKESLQAERQTSKNAQLKHQQREGQLNIKINQKHLEIQEKETHFLTKEEEIRKLKEKLANFDQVRRDLQSEIRELKEKEIPAYRNKVIEAQEQLNTQIKVNTQITFGIKEASELYEVLQLQHKEDSGKLSVAMDMIVKLEDEIKFLKDDKNRIYEVKIEKIIDRKEEFDLLEVEIQNLRRINTQLRSQLTLLNTNLINKDQLIEQLKKKLEQSQKTVLELKKLIQQRQKSFAWIVQRQIQQDIECNRNNEKNQSKVYRVQPLKEKLPVVLDQNSRVEAEHKNERNEQQILIYKQQESS